MVKISEEIIDSLGLVPQMSKVEKEGIKAIVDTYFEPVTGSSTTSEDLHLNYTNNGLYAILNAPSNDFVLEDGSVLSHVALTYNHMIILVSYTEDDEEVFHRIN